MEIRHRDIISFSVTPYAGTSRDWLDWFGGQGTTCPIKMIVWRMPRGTVVAVAEGEGGAFEILPADGVAGRMICEAPLAAQLAGGDFSLVYAHQSPGNPTPQNFAARLRIVRTDAMPGAGLVSVQLIVLPDAPAVTRPVEGAPRQPVRARPYAAAVESGVARWTPPRMEHRGRYEFIRSNDIRPRWQRAGFATLSLSIDTGFYISAVLPDDRRVYSAVASLELLIATFHPDYYGAGGFGARELVAMAAGGQPLDGPGGLSVGRMSYWRGRSAAVLTESLAYHIPGDLDRRVIARQRRPLCEPIYYLSPFACQRDNCTLSGAQILLAASHYTHAGGNEFSIPAPPRGFPDMPANQAPVTISGHALESQSETGLPIRMRLNNGSIVVVTPNRFTRMGDALWADEYVLFDAPTADAPDADGEAVDVPARQWADGLLARARRTGRPAFSATAPAPAPPPAEAPAPPPPVEAEAPAGSLPAAGWIVRWEHDLLAACFIERVDDLARIIGTANVEEAGEAGSARLTDGLTVTRWEDTPRRRESHGLLCERAARHVVTGDAFLAAGENGVRRTFLGGTADGVDDCQDCPDPAAAGVALGLSARVVQFAIVSEARIFGYRWEPAPARTRRRGRPRAAAAPGTAPGERRAFRTAVVGTLRVRIERVGDRDHYEIVTRPNVRGGAWAVVGHYGRCGHGMFASLGNDDTWALVGETVVEWILTRLAAPLNTAPADALHGVDDEDSGPQPDTIRQPNGRRGTFDARGRLQVG